MCNQPGYGEVIEHYKIFSKTDEDASEHTVHRWFVNGQGIASLASEYYTGPRVEPKQQYILDMPANNQTRQCTKFDHMKRMFTRLDELFPVKAGYDSDAAGSRKASDAGGSREASEEGGSNGSRKASDVDAPSDADNHSDCSYGSHKGSKQNLRDMREASEERAAKRRRAASSDSDA